MSNVNNQFKELVNEAIHNHFHDKTETEMILKDWLYGICEQLDEYEAKARAFDRIKGYNDRVFEGDLDSFDLSEAVGDVIEKYTIKRIIESGETDAKK